MVFVWLIQLLHNVQKSLMQFNFPYFFSIHIVPPYSIILKYLAGLYYELCNNSVYRDMCFKEAHQLAMAACKDMYTVSKGK